MGIEKPALHRLCSVADQEPWQASPSRSMREGPVGEVTEADVRAYVTKELFSIGAVAPQAKVPDVGRETLGGSGRP